MLATEKEVEKNYRDIEVLRDYAIDFMNTNYPNLDFKREYVNVNNRLTKTLGFFKVRKIADEYKEPKVEVAGRLLKYGHETIILDTLKHELIHYALCFLGLPYSDGNAIFEDELLKHNAPSNFRKSDIKFPIGEFYTYECKECNKEYVTRKKIVLKQPERYRTNCCSGIVILKSKKASDGYNIQKLKDL